ncbi:MAG: hypothetical protein C0475_06650 [Planctomyces sp.]|nr:hypothetical protein [Planctomyces sp.]
MIDRSTAPASVGGRGRLGGLAASDPWAWAEPASAGDERGAVTGGLAGVCGWSWRAGMGQRACGGERGEVGLWG